MLIVDEVSMMGARTLHAANTRLCQLRDDDHDFGGIPIVLFSGDFRQFPPVRDNCIARAPEECKYGGNPNSKFQVKARHAQQEAYRLWRRFEHAVMLDEQVRAAEDGEFQELLRRIRYGRGAQADVELLNRRCYRPGGRIP